MPHLKTNLVRISSIKERTSMFIYDETLQKRPSLCALTLYKVLCADHLLFSLNFFLLKPLISFTVKSRILILKMKKKNSREDFGEI